MPQENITDEELADLIRRVEDAAAAYFRGEVQTYLTLIKHTNDYTLMAPYGGEVTRGFDASPERLEGMARFFQGSGATLEVAQSYAAGDMVVLVAIERQSGTVGDLPEQDWSLRRPTRHWCRMPVPGRPIPQTSAARLRPDRRAGLPTPVKPG